MMHITGLIGNSKHGQDTVKNVTTFKLKENSAKFAGKFDQANLGMYIIKVLYNNPATVVFWSDGTKTVSKAQEGDIYNKELGLTLCVLKKLVGSSQVISLLNEWVDESTNYMDLKLIRAKKREANKIEEVKVEESVKKETSKKATPSTAKKKTSSTATKNKKEESTQQ